MIPELLKSVAGSITRWLLTCVAAYLVDKGAISGSDSELLIAGAGMGLATLAWSLWQKYKGRLTFLAALSLPQTATEEEAKREAKLRAGGVSVWSVALIFLLLPAAFGAQACSEDQLKVIASNVDRVAVLVADGREVRDELLANRIIDRDDAYKVTVGLYKVNSALKTFNDRARTYKSAGELTPAAKADLRKLAGDISSAATELVSNETFGVKNRDAQVRINSVIGSIRQVTLALIDTIERLKTKPPIQQANAGLLGLLPALILIFRKISDFVARERERTGKTPEEIFNDAGLQLEANQIALIGDLAALAPIGEISVEDQAKLDSLMAELEKRTQG